MLDCKEIGRTVVFVACLSLCNYCICEVKEGESCLNRNNAPGSCVTLTNCDFAIELIDQGKSPVFCNPGTENNFNALVCCNISNGQGLQKESLRQRISLDMCQRYFPELFGPDWPSNIRISVVSGRRTLAKEFPHMALIGYGEKDDIKWSCGGTLISEKFVLTAAHCLDTLAGIARWVRLGELDTASTTDDARPEDFAVNKNIPHPDYQNPSNYHDIGLLELEKNVTFSEYIKPACLYQAQDTSELFASATGWGSTLFGGTTSSHLMEATLVLVNNTWCNRFYKKVARTQLSEGIVEDTQICAGGNEGKDTCQGDSGGPLQILKPESHRRRNLGRNNYDIIGITSFGAACGLEGTPGIYTRVFPYLYWIEKNVWP